jgi:squalene monooxygenase
MLLEHLSLRFDLLPFLRGLWAYSWNSCMNLSTTETKIAFIDLLLFLSFFVLALLLLSHIFLWLIDFHSFVSFKLKSRAARARQKGDYSAERPEVIVVGAGIAGPAIGKALADQNRKVVIIERDLKEPDRIVGEFFQPGGINQLKSLNMEKCVDGIEAIGADGYYVFQNAYSYVKLPFPGGYRGCSFHHGRFVMKLRQCAQENPNVTMIEGFVSDLIEENGRVVGVRYKVTTGPNNEEQRELRAPLTIVCDGCYSNFRSKLFGTERKPICTSNFWGILVRDCKLPFENYGHVFLNEPAPVLSYRIDPRTVRVLVDIPLSVAKGGEAVYKVLLERTAPQLPSPLREGFVAALKRSQDPSTATSYKLRYMPNQKLHPAPIVLKGVIALGDTWNMRHPLTGGGMTVALSDCVYIRNLLQEIPDFANEELVDYVLQRFYKQREGRATTINILAFALYLVFCCGSDDPKVTAAIQNACYGYFLLGGLAIEGPMGLLSGLVPNPKVLLSHYTAVALWGALQYLWQGNDPLHVKLRLVPKILSAATNIFYPLLKAELFCDYRTAKQKQQWFYKWKRLDDVCWKILHTAFTVLFLLPKILHSVVKQNKTKNAAFLLACIVLCAFDTYIIFWTLRYSLLLATFCTLLISWFWFK